MPRISSPSVRCQSPPSVDSVTWRFTCNNNVIDILWISPLSQIVVNTSCIIDVQEAAFRSSEKPRVVLDCVALGWGVYDGEHFFQVLLDQLYRVSAGTEFEHRAISVVFATKTKYMVIST